MSYGFNVRAATKGEAIAAVEAEFDKVIAAQPCHVADRYAAMKNAEAVIAMLPEPSETQDVTVSMNGYMSWIGNVEDGNFTGASVAASANIMPKL